MNNKRKVKKKKKQRHLHTHVYCSTIHKAKLLKQPRCPTTNKWIKKVWYLYTVEFYSATKKNEILSFTGKWIELDNITLSEVSQAQKAKNRIFSLI
jgi:CDP-diacylglycerol pyrophosphatase